MTGESDLPPDLATRADEFLHSRRNAGQLSGMATEAFEASGLITIRWCWSGWPALERCLALCSTPAGTASNAPRTCSRTSVSSPFARPESCSDRERRRSSMSISGWG
jgi:hypothetical protein